MTVVALVPAIVAIVGALVYALTTGKASELGRVAFLCGLLATMFALAGTSIRLG
jgi:hypothetical protein